MVGGDNENSSEAGTGNRDLEVLAVPQKEFWKTVRYFGKGVVESPPHAFLVILALVLLAVTLPAMTIGGQLYAIGTFGMFLVVLVIIVMRGTSIQEAGLRREVERWVEANRAGAYFGKLVGDVNRAKLAVQETIEKYLEAYRDFVAVFLSLPKTAVRTNIFRPKDNTALVIPPGMHFNMDDRNELTIELPPGEGCTGSAYLLEKPIIATRETPEFPYGVPRPERAKPSARLQWILSLPIFARGRVIGVLNADGLDSSKTKEDLRRMISTVEPWAALLGNLLGDAQRERDTVASMLESKIASGEFDVFLCHNSADKPIVKEIGERLKERGILPWLDEWELRPGLLWQKMLEKQIGKIKSAAVFVGKNGIGPWQDVELDAFLRQFVRRQCPVIPVILSNCERTPELPLFLGGMTWVDFRSRDPDPMEQLIWGITGQRVPNNPAS